ncbi:MAG: methyl-accepting chemotaxis protein [Ilumatobacteraceae bacterium]
MAAIQADVDAAVAAIGEIVEVIGQINENQSTVAAAVQEQSATTDEINRNIVDVATSALKIGDDIQSVTVAASEASQERSRQLKPPTSCRGCRASSRASSASSRSDPEPTCEASNLRLRRRVPAGDRWRCRRTHGSWPAASRPAQTAVEVGNSTTVWSASRASNGTSVEATTARSPWRPPAATLTPLPARPWIGNSSAPIRFAAPLAWTTTISAVGGGRGADDLVAGGQFDPADPCCGAAHRAQIVGDEPDALALLRHQQHRLILDERQDRHDPLVVTELDDRDATLAVATGQVVGDHPFDGAGRGHEHQVVGEGVVGVPTDHSHALGALQDVDVRRGLVGREARADRSEQLPALGDRHLMGRGRGRDPAKHDTLLGHLVLRRRLERLHVPGVEHDQLHRLVRNGDDCGRERRGGDVGVALDPLEHRGHLRHSLPTWVRRRRSDDTSVSSRFSSVRRSDCSFSSSTRANRVRRRRVRSRT